MLWWHSLAGLALCAAMLPVTGNAAVTEDTFQLRTTSDLVEFYVSLLPWLTRRGGFMRGRLRGTPRSSSLSPWRPSWSPAAASAPTP